MISLSFTPISILTNLVNVFTIFCLHHLDAFWFQFCSSQTHAPDYLQSDATVGEIATAPDISSSFSRMHKKKTLQALQTSYSWAGPHDFFGQWFYAEKWLFPGEGDKKSMYEFPVYNHQKVW